jgi:signal transduction histidine kinase
MGNDVDIALTVVVATVMAVLLVGFAGLLLVLNANRRHRHRAELAELRAERDRELRRVEREATSHTLTEVGRELHDNIGQLLTVAEVGLQDHLDPAVLAHPRVRASLEALERSVVEVRRLGRSLNRDDWARRELIVALEREAERLDRLGRAQVIMHVEGSPGDPSPDVKTILFRAFQETVANSLRHSRARTLFIGVSDAPGFQLVVSDDGNGFDPRAVASGSGLGNIRERCRLVGYSATLETTPGQGCSWTFKPLSNDAP